MPSSRPHRRLCPDPTCADPLRVRSAARTALVCGRARQGFASWPVERHQGSAPIPRWEALFCFSLLQLQAARGHACSVHASRLAHFSSILAHPHRHGPHLQSSRRYTRIMIPPTLTQSGRRRWARSRRREWRYILTSFYVLKDVYDTASVTYAAARLQNQILLFALSILMEFGVR
jgi:hypothetical protein